MATILDTATATSFNIKDVTYISEDDKKVLGVLGDVMLVNSNGEELSLSSVSGGDTIYSNAYDDFTAAIVNNTRTITITGLPYTLEAMHVVGGIIYKIKVTTLAVTTVPLTNVSVAAGVITLADSPVVFDTGDVVVVYLAGPKKSYDVDLDLQKTQEQSPLNEQYVEASIVDTTNVATGTYYPAATGMPFGAYKNLSLTGKLIDGAAETTTLTIEVTNDEDTAGDWIQIYGYNTKTNAMVNLISALNQTTTFAWDFDGFNYRHLRLLITATAATNTVIIKMRRSY